MPIRIIFADDHQVVRQGLRPLLEAEGFRVAGEAPDGHEAVRLAETLRPELAVLDLAMPRLNGLDAARAILRASPSTKPVLLTMHTEGRYVSEALRAGVRGYVLKSQASADLAQAIREVSRGLIYLSPGISRAVVEAYLAKSEVPPDPLTLRERQVLQLVAESKTAKEVAALLGIRAKTAESHRSRIMAKLNVHDRAGLVRYAISNGLIQV
jgi:two-component system, NarL family, response regulator NreC